MKLPGHIGYHEDYGFMMRDAHRRPAQVLRPPSITWHLGIIRPPDLTSEQWYEHIERYILDILRDCVHDALGEGRKGSVGISNLHDEPQVFTAANRDGDHPVSMLRNSYNLKGTKHGLTGQGRYETVVIGGHWEQQDYWIRVEAFDEYFAITSALHLPTSSSTPLAEADGKDDGTPLSPLQRSIKVLADYINERYAALAGDTALPRSVSSATCDAANALYRVIWSSFGQVFLDAAFSGNGESALGTTRPQIGNDATARVLRGVFADFRGLVLSIVNPKYVLTPGSERREVPHIGDMLALNATLAARVEGSTKCIWRDDSESGADDEINRWVESVLPVLMTQELPKGAEPRKPPFEPTEYTFSTFADKRYIYGSGFGPQLERSQNNGIDGSPLTYVLLCFHDEWRQIGRAVLRLHTMGMLRLAAFFELRKLMQRDEVLQNLERELREFDQINSLDAIVERRKSALLDLQTSLEWIAANLATRLRGVEPFIEKVRDYLEEDKKAGEQTQAQTKKLHVKRRKDLIRLERKLDSLKSELQRDRSPKTPERRRAINELRAAHRAAQIFNYSRTQDEFRETVLMQVRKALAGMDAGVRDGGISYRAYRSEYARRLFESLVDAMRIHQVRGYQPYNVFVRHRLARAWGLMQAVAARFTQIQNIERLHRERLDNEKMVRHQRTLRNLQQGAEVGFWVILAPYYLAYVSEKALLAMFKVAQASDLAKYFHEYYAFGWLAVVWIAFGLAVSILRLREGRSSSWPKD